MDIKSLFKNTKTRILISVIIGLVIIVGLFVLSKDINLSKTETPSLDSPLHEIEMLLLGDGSREDDKNEDGLGTDEIEQLSQDSTEQDEIEDEQITEENAEEELTEDELTADKKENTEADEQNDQISSEESQEGDTDSESDEQGTGDGEYGQEDGLIGEEGGEEVELDLAMVMKWYKYGSEPKTIVCGPSDKVSGNINTAQLKNNELEYNFEPTGDEAKNTRITEVHVKEGDSPYSKISEKGKLKIHVPDNSAGRDYTFKVTTIWKTTDSNGNKIEQEVIYTYVIHFAYALDAELELTWQKNDSETSVITCVANGTAARTVASNDLTDNVFAYTPKIVGALAEEAKLIKGEYTTLSGDSGTLDIEGGTILFNAKGSAGKETYYLAFEAQVKDEDGITQTVYYHFTIDFTQLLDIDVNFVWLEKGHIPRTLICKPESKVSTEIKNNQLSAGAVKYEVTLSGDDSNNARILSMSYTSDGTGGGNLATSGSLPFSMASGQTSNTYKITVVVLSGGKQMNYEIQLNYSMDAGLEMSYVVNENGVPTRRTVLCENGKTKNAETIYDDQLDKGKLSYEMNITGTDVLNIESVSCYQSSNKSIISLDAKGHIKLSLNAGKTSENTFTVVAKDESGNSYRFIINIPYKHRGENNIKISTNARDGQIVTNEAAFNLSVSAWSEDETGKVVSYIPANGTDTKLIVKLNGQVVKYTSSSGPNSEYVLYPPNSSTGYKNEHELYIYAEDPDGNYGELTITLVGHRSEAGQKKGIATIRIDMTVLGIEEIETITYDVLAKEPISYSVAKAVMGIDTGSPFGGPPENSLAWGGDYTGTLSIGFYLARLNPGLEHNALEKTKWADYGSTDEEILSAIDRAFPDRPELATRWRCIYLNGITKSPGRDGSYGEHDFTSKSGWVYALNGLYYPGLSMSEYSLEDGDVLTLRYTLANCWDVGGGASPDGDEWVGFCVTAIDGEFYVDHQMETVTKPDGSKVYRCECCGLEEDCVHENTEIKNLGTSHVLFCKDCLKEIEQQKSHVWNKTEEEHVCKDCGAKETHNWVTVTDTATCKKEGKLTEKCTSCNMERVTDSPIKEHTLDETWHHTAKEHYTKCSVCKEIIEGSRGEHKYFYHEGDDDWYCIDCDAGHDWIYCGNDKLVVVESETTCQKIKYHCSGECGLYFELTGIFDEYHNYVDGICSHCGGAQELAGEPEPGEEPQTDEG